MTRAVCNGDSPVIDHHDENNMRGSGGRFSREIGRSCAKLNGLSAEASSLIACHCRLSCSSAVVRLVRRRTPRCFGSLRLPRGSREDGTDGGC